MAEFGVEERGARAMADVVTFGEAMVRLAPPGQRRLEQTASLEVTVGGAELNVATGVSRLGLQAAWVSSATREPFGQDGAEPGAGVRGGHTPRGLGRRGAHGAVLRRVRRISAREQRALRSGGLGVQPSAWGLVRLARHPDRRAGLPHDRHHPGAGRAPRPRSPGQPGGCPRAAARDELRPELPRQALEPGASPRRAGAAHGTRRCADHDRRRRRNRLRHHRA